MSLLTASLLEWIRTRPNSSEWQRRERFVVGKRMYEHSHLVVFKQRTHLVVDCVLVRNSWKATHVQATIFFRRALEVLCCILSLPSIEDVWVTFFFFGIPRCSGLRAPAAIIGQCWRSGTFGSILASLRRIDVDLNRTTHDLLPIQFSHCTVSFLGGTKLDKAIRWVSASEWVRGHIDSLAEKVV